MREIMAMDTTPWAVTLCDEEDFSCTSPDSRLESRGMGALWVTSDDGVLSPTRLAKVVLHAWGKYRRTWIGEGREPPLTDWIFVGGCALLNHGNKFYPVLVGGVWYNARTMKRLPTHVIGTPLQMTRFAIKSADELDRLKKKDHAAHGLPLRPGSAARPDTGGGSIGGHEGSNSSSSSNSEYEDYVDDLSDEYGDGDDDDRFSMVAAAPSITR
jgi:hypothetical protein